MATYTQDTRPIRIDTVVGDDLLIARLEGTEAMSQLFRFQLDLVAERADVESSKLLRTPALVHVNLPQEEERLIHGHISRFAQVGREEDLYLYRAEVVPWTWFLSLRRNCRIFQNRTILDIAQLLFREHGFSDYEIRCGDRPAREYVVQYDESDLAFVSRWLEAEGIFYYFEHTAERHTLVLADSNSGLNPCPIVSVANMTARPVFDEDTVRSLLEEQSVQPGRVTLKDYDFLQPSLTLEASLAGEGDYEVFEYPGNFTSLEDGDRYARYRLEAEEAKRREVRGTGNCRWMTAGHTFELRGHWTDALNAEYLLTAVRHDCRVGGFRSRDSSEIDYRNEFTAIPSDVPCRPQRVTPLPRVRGSQTAVVVGPAGEEVFLDRYGRVKVQFHWDREGRRDENSSCWVRFATPWGGKGYGAVSFPRIGTEVLIDFLEGDPDRPIITACVYNAEQMPPFELPGAGIQMGMKSRSSKGGGGFNEFTMTDTKGEEKVTIHAQKDMSTVVQNDQTVTVVSGNRTMAVQSGTLTDTIKGDASLTIQAGSRTVDVTGGDYSTTASGGVVLHGKSEGVTITGDAKGVGITGNGKGVGIEGNGEGVGIVGNGKGVGIEGNGEGVGIVGNGKGVGIKGDPDFLAEGTATANLKGPVVNIGDKEINITGTKVTISAGASSIVLDPGGVTIQGPLVKIN